MQITRQVVQNTNLALVVHICQKPVLQIFVELPLLLIRFPSLEILRGVFGVFQGADFEL